MEGQLLISRINMLPFLMLWGHNLHPFSCLVILKNAGQILLRKYAMRDGSRKGFFLLLEW
jgi:hypothetical protein